MPTRLDASALNQLFLEARTQNAWQARDVPDSVLKEIVAIMLAGPTSANCEPARVLFIKSTAAKQRLSPFLSEGNRAKTMQAPVCAIIGYDLRFYEHLPKLFPHNLTARSWFEGNDAHVQTTAMRNGSLQGAYFMLAARALGLDIGAMSGFDNAGVDKEFFSGTDWRSNFLVNIGHGDPSGVMQRLPRLAFEEYARIV